MWLVKYTQSSLFLIYVLLSSSGFTYQSSEKILILQYMDGIRLNDSESLDAYGIDKQKLVEEITRAYAHQIYVDGFFNGDPHPGMLAFNHSPRIY